MHISATGPAAQAMHLARTPEAAEGPGPDRDGDADDKGVSGASTVQAASPPAGMGKSVNISA